MFARTIFVAVILVLQSALLGDAADAPPSTAMDQDRIKSMFEKSVPPGWQVIVKGSAVALISPNEMKLDPSPATGLPDRSVVKHFTIWIRIGEKISIKECELRQKKDDDENARFGKDAPGVGWLPDFFDDTNAYDLQFPKYCPANEKDRKAVNECFLQVRRHWAAYPGSSAVDLHSYLSALNLAHDHGGTPNRE